MAFPAPAFPPPAPGDAGKVLTAAPGSAGPAVIWDEPPASASPYFDYAFNAGTTAPPGGGQIRLNNPDQTAATLAWLHYTTAPGNDARNLLGTISAGETLYLQDKDDSTRWQKYTVGAAGTDHTTYIEFPLTWIAGGTAIPAQRVFVSFIGGGGGTVGPDLALSGHLLVGATPLSGSPPARIEAVDASAPQLRLVHDATNVADLRVDGGGALNLNSAGGVQTTAPFACGRIIAQRVDAGGAGEAGFFKNVTGPQIIFQNAGTSGWTALESNATGDLTITPQGGDTTITGTLTVSSTLTASVGGDLSGSLPNPAVARIQGLAIAAPVSGDAGRVLTVGAGGTSLGWVTPSGGGSLTPPVGINTATPRRMLDVLDTANPQLRLTYADNTLYSDLQTDSAGNLTLLPSSGAVGVNATPMGRLYVFGPTMPSASGATVPVATPLLYIAGGQGGDNTIATTGTGGAGAAVNLVAGPGGGIPNATTAATAGSGGNHTTQGGTGANALVAGTGTNRGGDGGTAFLNGGPAGNATGATSGTNTGGTGGPATVQAGQGGTATTGSGNLVGGAGGTTTVRGGPGGAGATSGGAGGPVNVFGGAASSSPAAAGGTATLQGGAGSTAASGGQGGGANVTGADASGNNTADFQGGSTLVKAGASRGNAVGATASVTGGIGGFGQATTGATGGPANVVAGKGGNNTTGGPGGTTNVTGGAGGNGTTTNGSGGIVAIDGGNAGAGAGTAGTKGAVCLQRSGGGYVGIGNSGPGTQLHNTEALSITGNLADAYAAAHRFSPGYTAAGAQTVTRHNYFDLLDASPLTNVTVTDACVFRFNAAIGTHKAVAAASTKATPGTVQAWMKMNCNGAVLYCPLYTSTTA